MGVNLICTETEIKDGFFTGHYSTADCSSEQKRLRILENYDIHQYQNIYAYGNSVEDLEMLSLANHTYMVGEDTSLPHIVTEQVPS